MEIARDIEAIDNLDVAKMTLRWALERMRSLEMQNSDLKKQLSETESSLSLRSQQAREKEAYGTTREAYYARFEPLLNEFCKGTLDLKKLLLREAESAHRADAIRGRQEELESEYGHRLGELERHFKKLQFELQAQDKLRAEETARALLERKNQLDRTYISREAGLHAADHQLSVREKALAEREARNSVETRKREEQLNRELVETQSRYRQLQDDLFQQNRAQLRDWDKERAQIQARREETAAIEREDLLSQLKKWEETGSRYLERIAALEGGKLQSERKSFEMLHELEKRLEELNAEHRRRSADLDQRHSVLMESLTRRREELGALEETVIQRFADFETHERERDSQWREREEALRTRDREWHKQIFAHKSAAAEAAMRVEELKAELIMTVRDYKRKLEELPKSGPEAPPQGD